MSGEQQPVRHSTGAARRGRWLTFTLYTLVVLLLATAGGGFVLYTRLNANISSSELYTGTTGSAGCSRPTTRAGSRSTCW